jgi:hypothetical protein
MQKFGVSRKRWTIFGHDQNCGITQFASGEFSLRRILLWNTTSSHVDRISRDIFETCKWGCKTVRKWNNSEEKFI